jgi:hypothetical protein
MCRVSLWFVVGALSVGAELSAPSAVVVSVGDAVLHTVDSRFVSFTMDTGFISSGYSSGDLEAPDVLALARAVGPGFLRLSGGRADSLGYRPDGPVGAVASVLDRCVGDDCGNCDAANTPGGAPPAAIGPATEWFNLSAWRRINTFAASAGLDVLYGLNSKARPRTDAPWDGRNGMLALINWTAAQPLSRFPVAGYELGNEPDLFCRGNTSVPPAVMARDFMALRARLDKVGRAAGRYIALYGPDTAGIGSHITNSTTGNPDAVYKLYFSQWASNISSLVAAAGAGSAPPVDEITFHQYYFKGPTANKTGEQFVDVGVLDSLLPKIRLAVAHSGASKHGASLGETASAYDGGAALSSSYAATFPLLDKLGLSARAGLRRVMHQELCCGSGSGNEYILLQGRGHAPTASYWATLLWKRLVGGRVLGVAGDLAPGRTLRAYAHCAKNVSGGVALTLLNVAREAASVDVRVGAGDVRAQRRDEYRLSTVEGTFVGQRTTLNGRELLLSGSVLPPLTPSAGVASDPLLVPPLSVAFVVLPEARVPACA